MTTLIHAIALRGISNAEVFQQPTAIEARDDVLATVALTQRVSSPDAIVAQIRGLKAMLRDVEATRVTVKDVPLRLTRDIDTAAKAFGAPIQSELTRLERLYSGWAIEQERARAAAERAKRDAEEAIRREQEAERRRLEAERERLEAEQARLELAAATASTPAQENAVAQETFTLGEQAARVETEQAALDTTHSETVSAVAELFPVAPPPPVAVKMVTRWEVTDLDTLADFDRSLVRIEPSARAIDAAIKAGHKSIPGLRIWTEAEARVR